VPANVIVTNSGLQLQVMFALNFQLKHSDAQWRSLEKICTITRCGHNYFSRKGFGISSPVEHFKNLVQIFIAHLHVELRLSLVILDVLWRIYKVLLAYYTVTPQNV